MIGPVPPPSSWPLEDVPGTILDIIVDYLADDAEISHHCDGGSCIYGIACFGVKPVVPLSPGLKNLSMVSSDFRHNVMARKIAHTVHLKSTSHIVKQRRRIRKETYACIRQIMLGPSNLPNIDFKAWNAHRNAFIKLCPNLERVRDDSGEIACNKHVFPASLTHLRLLLRSDKTNVQTIHAPGLQNLLIGLDPLGLTEFAVAHLAAGFPKRLAKILRHVKKLDRLEMQLPGLPLTFHENITELQLPDPIPASLETLGSLELEIPFCTIEHESLRATAWFGYLAWLCKTPSNFNRLAITMTWLPSPFAYGPPNPFTYSPPSTRSILDSMGLSGVEETDGGTRLKGSGESAISDLQDYFQYLLENHQALEVVHFRCWALLPLDERAPPVLFRDMVGVKKREASANNSVGSAFDDRILLDVVDRIIRDSQKRSKHAVTLPPITIHGPDGPLNMADALPPELAAHAAAAMNQIMANFVPGIAPIVQPPVNTHPSEDDEWEETG